MCLQIFKDIITAKIYAIGMSDHIKRRKLILIVIFIMFGELLFPPESFIAYCFADVYSREVRATCMPFLIII